MQRIAIALAMALLSASALAQGGPAALIAECDRLAASDLDIERPTSVLGVPVAAVDGKRATAACLAAAKAAPKDARVLYQLGRALQVDKKDDDARKQYALSDSMGYAAATYNLAATAEQAGKFPEARRLNEKAAAAGNPMAMRALAYNYDHGTHGFSMDPAQSARWYERSRPGFAQLAERGSPTAMFQTGWMYHQAKGGPEDLNKALFWYQKAANVGFPQAMNNLAAFYEDDIVVTADLVLAERWYEKALQAGYQPAADNLARVRQALGK